MAQIPTSRLARYVFDAYMAANATWWQCEKDGIYEFVASPAGMLDSFLPQSVALFKHDEEYGNSFSCRPGLEFSNLASNLDNDIVTLTGLSVVWTWHIRCRVQDKVIYQGLGAFQTPVEVTDLVRTGIFRVGGNL